MKRNKAFFVLCASLLGVTAFAQRSLDQIDRASFGEVTSPLDYEASSMMTVRRFLYDGSFLWVPSGESVSVTMNDVSGKVRVTSFNCAIINE